MLVLKRFRTNILLNYCDTKNATNFAPSLPIGVSQKQLFAVQETCMPPTASEICVGMCIEESFNGLIFHISFQKQGILFATKDICPIVSRPCKLFTVITRIQSIVL